MWCSAASVSVSAAAAQEQNVVVAELGRQHEQALGAAEAEADTLAGQLRGAEVETGRLRAAAEEVLVAKRERLQDCGADAEEVQLRAAEEELVAARREGSGEPGMVWELERTLADSEASRAVLETALDEARQEAEVAADKMAADLQQMAVLVEETVSEHGTRHAAAAADSAERARVASELEAMSRLVSVLKQQKEEAQTAAEEASQQKRALVGRLAAAEARLVSQQQHLEAAPPQSPVTTGRGWRDELAPPPSEAAASPIGGARASLRMSPPDDSPQADRLSEALGVIGQLEEDLAVVNAEVAALNEVGRGASVATLESACGWAVSLFPEVGAGACAEPAAPQVVVALRAQNAEAMATVATLGQAVGDGEAEAAATEDERDAVLEEVALLRAELQAARNGGWLQAQAQDAGRRTQDAAHGGEERAELQARLQASEMRLRTRVAALEDGAPVAAITAAAAGSQLAPLHPALRFLAGRQASGRLRRRWRRRPGRGGRRAPHRVRWWRMRRTRRSGLRQSRDRRRPRSGRLRWRFRSYMR
jgi:hypothetical protein